MGRPRGRRVWIWSAGLVVNLIFPIFLLAGVFFLKGKVYPPYLDMPVQVVAFPANASNSPDGLRVGDKVVSIAGVRNPTWEQAEKVILAATPGAPLPVEVENGGVRRTVNLAVPARDPKQYVRLFGYSPIPPVIIEVASDSPPYKAGLQTGDKITALNG